MLEGHRIRVDERGALGITSFVPDAEQTAASVELLKSPPAEVETR